MMSSILHSMFRLPTIERFMDNALSQLRNGISGLFLLPKSIPLDDFQFEIRAEFDLRRIDYLEIDLNNASDSDCPVICLCKAVNIQWKDPTTPRILSQLPDSCILGEPIPDMVWIKGLENQASDTIMQWINASQIWAENGKIIRDRGYRLPSICIVLPTSKCIDVPNNDIFFRVYCWWGMPSLLETRMLCAEIDGFVSDDSNWRRYIVPHLCAGDLFLLSHLFSAKSLDEKEIGLSLMNAAYERGWTRDFLVSIGAGDYMSLNNLNIFHEEEDPFGALFKLWGEGIVNSYPGTGLFFSSPALYVMGKHAEIRHRLWCGQLELVMPMLNNVRLAICSYLTMKHGKDWPIRYSKPKDPQEEAAVRENPINCQFGHLETVLFNWPGRIHIFKSLANHLKVLRYFRNEIAHNRSIRFCDYQDICETVEQVLSILRKETSFP